MSSILIVIPGLPQQQGSKNPYGGDTNKNLKPWRRDAILAIKAAMVGREKLHGPVQLSALFSFPRPQSHYGTGKNLKVLKDGAPVYKAGRPDVDKLLRAACDALTQAGAYVDDAQVCLLKNVIKVWGEPETILEIDDLSQPA